MSVLQGRWSRAHHTARACRGEHAPAIGTEVATLVACDNGAAQPCIPPSLHGRTARAATLKALLPQRQPVLHFVLIVSRLSGRGLWCTSAVAAFGVKQGHPRHAWGVVGDAQHALESTVKPCPATARCAVRSAAKGCVWKKTHYFTTMCRHAPNGVHPHSAGASWLHSQAICPVTWRWPQTVAVAMCVPTATHRG